MYNGAVADTFLPDDLFGADKTILAEGRIYLAVKREQKLTATVKATLGQSGRGGSTFGRRDGGRRGRQWQYNKQSDYSIDYLPNGQPFYGRFNGNDNFGGKNGNGRGNGGGT